MEEITSLDDFRYDPSKRAEAVLDHILSGESKKKDTGVSAEEALASRPVLDQNTGRIKARVLFITTKEDVLIEGTSVRQYFAGLASCLDEVHIICLVPRIGKEDVVRGAKNFWIYPVRGKYWWSLPWAAVHTALEDLSFGGGFRPDIVVGIDPFEGGLASYLIARKYKRPWQIHIYSNPFSKDYKEAAPDNNWRIRIAKFILKRVTSVRTTNSITKDIVVKKYKRLKDIALLPRFYNFTGLLSSQPAFSLREKYPDFSFIMLAFGPLDATSYLHDVFSATYHLLQNPRVGLIVVGDGKAKELFEEKTRLLGIEKSVVFQKSVDDLASYLKTADALVEVGVNEDSEVRVLQAAAAGLPIVAVSTPLREDLFDKDNAAMLIKNGDLVELGQKLGQLINNASSLRIRMAGAAQFVAESRLHEDPETYYQSIASSIESVL